MKKAVRILLAVACSLLTLSVMAQATRTVKGTVVDELGEPIIGATVQVVGTTTGTITDVDGNYVIQAPEKSTLKVMFLGY
ncbi:MAG: carboxypeptidase-like regulatory domain-containing protein, partial [Bacteroidales bacterium]|nr:carboxypeptidase-like regulatory domain-containing protein [Bacteroidales bacterium]